VEDEERLEDDVNVRFAKSRSKARADVADRTARDLG
jgi:hypothetical protein